MASNIAISMFFIPDLVGAIIQNNTKNHLNIVLVILSGAEVEPDTNSVSHGALHCLIIE